MELKAINIIQKDYNDIDDFFLSCEAYIGPEGNSYIYEVYDFNVISIKRLYESFEDMGIMLNKGWMITKYYDEDEIRRKINSIIKSCISDNEEAAYLKIGSYLRKQDA